MRARLAQYRNEFFSLSIMALMSIALIAGQAGAMQAPAAEPIVDVTEHVMVIDIDFRSRHEGE